MKEAKQINGFSFLNLALYAFGGLGMECIYAYLLEPMLYGHAMNEFTTWQTILHWIITCITWGIITWRLVIIAKERYCFDLWMKTDKVKLWQFICVVLCVIIAIFVSYMDWDGFKVIREFQHKGWFKFIFQYIYYFFETALFMLIIIFGQKAFEKWFQHENIPYGGIVVALTWGLAHIFTKGSLFTGLVIAAYGFAFGTVYLLLNRNLKWTYLVLCMMFML
jgi:hypothetical protein